MHLARSNAVKSHDLVWWYVIFDSGLRAPIVGIELSSRDSQTDQWILTERGVRCFRYQGTRLRAAGPPLPTVGVPEDREQARRWLLHYLPQVAPHRVLAPQAIAKARSMTELVGLFRARWPEAMVDPPARLTPYALADELEAFPHGLRELVAAFKNVGE
ncbi:MAG: hypothetical protein V2A79_12105 [Planctomycetota bacterium]